ncbi:MAG TPA: zinc-binding alcohol dehydrogenase family protein [Actinocrinis sp.]
MKATAARLVEHGKPLEVTEIDLPEPGPGEVVVDMLYGGVNPVDTYRAAGRVNPDAPLPRTLGAEGSGTVDGRTVVVTGHGVGTSRDGIWATKAVVPRSALTDVPPGVDPKDAAVMGVAGVTAWRTVTELGEVTADDRVLVLGASGGVGSVVVSLAHGIGARVWGQAGSPDSADWIRGLGAERVLTGGADDLAAQAAQLQPTAVFDPLGGAFTGAAIEAMAPHGRLVIFGTSAGASGTVSLQALYRSGLRIVGYAGLLSTDEALSAALAAALQGLAEKRFEVVVGSVVPLGAVDEAFSQLASRKVRGKLVLDLRG